MAVSLLPQAPPRHQPEARPPSGSEAVTDDAPSFAATLSQASAVKSVVTKPATTAPSAPAASAAAKPEEGPAAVGEDALAGLLLAGATLLGTVRSPPPASASAAPGVPEDTAGPAASADRPTAKDTDPLSALAASLGLLQPAPGAVPPSVPSPLPGDRAAEAPVAATTSTESARALPADAAKAARREAATLDVETASGRVAAREVPAGKDAAQPLLTPSTKASEIQADEAPLRKGDAVAGVAVTDPATVATAPAARPPVQVTIATPAFTPGWRDEVTQQLTQLVLLRHDRADIRMNPADLGPISVQIQMDNGQANLLIQAPQPATRDGLELALPQLRDSLAQQGITLGETSIRDERAPGQGRGEREPAGAAGSGADEGTAIAPLAIRARVGLVDLFA